MKSNLLSLLRLSSRSGQKWYARQAPGLRKRQQQNDEAIDENDPDKIAKFSYSRQLEKEKKKEIMEPRPQFTGTEESKHDYENYIIQHRNQANRSFRPTDISPEKQTIFLFPGQGSQYVGMGKSLIGYPNVQTMYDRASELLGYDLYEMCTRGPAERLNRTRYQQPALFVTSLAGVERLKAERPEAIVNCIGACGMSIGEYAALVFAGSLKFEAGLQLVEQRGRYMEQMCDDSPSGMLTVHVSRASELGTAMEGAKYYAQTLGVTDPVCQISTFLSDELRVIGGHFECLNFLEKYGNPEFKIRTMKRLDVEGAFHSSLMKEGAFEFKEDYLWRTNFRKPRIPVYSNVDGKMFPDDARGIRTSLFKSMYKAVRWEQLMHTIYTRKRTEPMPTTYEIGPSSQLLTTLRINRPSRRAFQSAIPVDSPILKLPVSQEETDETEKRDQLQGNS